MRAAAAPPPPAIAAPATRAEDYYVLSDAALTASATWRRADALRRRVPAAAKKDEAKKALQAKIRRERAARGTPCRDAVGEEIDAQDAAFAASAAADGGGAAPKSAPAPRARAHATVTRNRQLADGAVVVTLVAASLRAAAGRHHSRGGGPPRRDGGRARGRGAGAGARARATTRRRRAGRGRAYAAALACDTVAAVEGLRPADKEDVAGGAVPKRLVRELRSLARDLPVHAASSVLLRFDAVCPLYMRALITGPPRTPYEHGCFEFEVECPADYPAKLPRVLISIQGLVLGTRHPHFNEPATGGWEGTETDHGRGRALSTGEEAMSHVPPDARKTDEVLAVQTSTARGAAAANEPFGDAILRHFEHKKAAIAQTVEARCFEADAYYADTAEAFKAAPAATRRSLSSAPPPRARAARWRESSTDRDIAKLEAQLEDLRRRKLAEDAAAMDTDEAEAEDDDAMDDGGDDDMDEDDDDDDDGDDAGYAGPEKFAGAGRTLASARRRRRRRRRRPTSRRRRRGGRGRAPPGARAPPLLAGGFFLRPAGRPLSALLS
ncbi:hypothetical protein JL721_12457 [Aureococcus anophagefferens]|nr:hypothetical protein JL721_12457 [Aureococcus anophagefferens]